MQFLMNMWNRIRKIDLRKLTPVQIVLGIAAAIVALWLVSQVVGLLLSLLPLAALVLIGYFGFRWLSSRSEDIPEEATRSRKARTVDEAVANVSAAEEGQVTRTDETEDDALTVKQIVNPETGFKEPDISRLVEREEEKLREADRINDEVMSQLEERRARLLAQQQQQEQQEQQDES